jgi:serine/threonine protein kinase
VLSAGGVFAGFRVERVLGVGGMGVVYLVRHPVLPRFEALKVLGGQWSGDRGFRARFVREAEVAAGLDHPNIVSVYGRGECEGQLWIAMQFVDGSNAADVAGHAPMAPSRAVFIVGEVAKALDYAHGRGVVHRDVKPHNFLLTSPRGGEQRVLLGDFGIARAVGDTALTAAGSVSATLAYAAPEVLSGGGFDSRSDVYSLGCALFRLLTGVAPFSGAGGVAAGIAAHLYAPPPSLRERAPWLPAGMAAVIATALAKDPAQRFGSARQLADAAAHALDLGSGGAVVPGAPAGPGVGQTRPWQISTPTPPPPPAPAPPPAPSGGRALLGPLAPWQPVPLTKHRRRGRTALLAGGVLTVVVAVTITTITVLTNNERAPLPTPTNASSAPAPPPPPTMAPTTLPTLLLPLPKITDITGITDMAVTASLTNFDDESALLGDQDKDCVAPWHAAQILVYANTGWLNERTQVLQGGGAVVSQSVIAYPSPGIAQQVMQQQAPQWSQCAGRTVTVTAPNEAPQQYRFSSPSTYDGVLTITSTVVAGVAPGLSMGCQHALAARNNIVIDTEFCRQEFSHQAVDILDTIAAQIPQ